METPLLYIVDSSLEPSSLEPALHSYGLHLILAYNMKKIIF
jgi:hypothetical protein